MKSFIKNKLVKTVLCGLISFGLVFAGLSTVSAASVGRNAKDKTDNSSLKPIFNNNANDYSLIRVAKTPANGNDFSATYKAEDGDTVAVMLYYHNNVVNSTAKNTSLSANFSTDESKTHSLSAALWADNADKVTGAATISTDKDSTLTYVKGSTLWYPNRNQNPNAAGIATADGVVGKGINIHDICGCWEYAGFVSFKVKVNVKKITPPVKPDKPVVEKTIKIEQIQEVTSLPKTGSPLATIALLSAVLAGLVVSGYVYFSSKKEMVLNK